MSTTTPKALVTNSAFLPALLTASLATYYTVPAATTTIIKQFTLRNVTTSPVLVYVYAVPSGGTADTSNEIFKNYVAPEESASLLEYFNLTLGPAATIQAYAGTASAVNITASGNERVA